MSKTSSLTLQALPYTPDSTLLFTALRDLPYAVFLDSAQPYSSHGRYDIITAQPRYLLKEPDSQHTTKTTFFARLQQQLQQQPYTAEGAHDLPFIGGAVGYFSYDLARQLERLPCIAANDLDTPEALVGIYDWGIVVDHQQRRTLLVAQAQAEQTLINDVLQRLRKPTSIVHNDFHCSTPLRSNLPFKQYQQAFQQIKRYIEAGDCYQVNLAQRWSAGFVGDPWQAYQRLRKVAAAPYSAYIAWENKALMSLSPEQFIHVNGHKVTTSPIKGTIARSPQAQEDKKLAHQLLHSAKDRAENVMIVDLLRHDLGKYCTMGSVHVDALCQLESFATVHHLISTISGTLKPSISTVDVLAGCFPGGSITGAPKIRAMEIIEALEPQRRSVYCGAVAYISYHQRMDSNIAIRTLLCEHDRLYCWAGGGIVHDSTCAQEYRESCLKVEKLLHHLGAKIDG